jgi:hypothetical protein
MVLLTLTDNHFFAGTVTPEHKKSYPGRFKSGNKLDQSGDLGLSVK